MKAILINPKLQTINEINYSGDYKDIYKLTECSTFTAIYPFDNCEDTIYLDDEGLLKSSNYCFTFRCDDGRNEPLMGNALILGTDEEGDSKDVETSIDEIKRRVSFKGHQAIDHGREINLSPIPTILNDDDIARMLKDHD
tara:strand:- start:346 stop:765 length:420 start_codon:yes stop_codon:yes gene_type:complete